MKGLVLGLLMLAQGPTQLEIVVRPQAVMQGATIRLRCRVPKDPENRKLRWGLEFWRNAEENMEGEKAQITYERLITEIPCDPGPAYCETTRASGKKSRVVVDVRVVGCTGPDQDPFTR